MDGVPQSSFSAPPMERNRDISFGNGSPIICDSQSPALTCKSSFSSFMVESSTPMLELGGFSFCSNGGSNSTEEFSMPVLSMSSFAFSPVSEQGNCAFDLSANICRVDSVHRGNMIANSSLHSEHEAADEAKKEEGTSGYRMSVVHSKRNRTIGLGEVEQLDFMATVSVIRWASCTHLPTATSLRSSLVC